MHSGGINIKLDKHFNYLMTQINLTDKQKENLINKHIKLRERLNSYDNLSDILVGDFLQGSYIRSTAVRPRLENKSDVDIVVVTNLDKNNYEPIEAFELFEEFLKDFYEDKYEFGDRSIKIKLSDVDIDLAITTAPSEVDRSENTYSNISNLTIEEYSNEKIALKNRTDFFRDFLSEKTHLQWKNEALYLADKEEGDWIETNPLEQVRKTTEKNSDTGGKFVKVVKALKWWNKNKYPDSPHPRSYRLERLIYECCPQNFVSIADGITLIFEDIFNNYEDKPELEDHGVSGSDVFKNLSSEHYDEFYKQVSESAVIAREALESNDKAKSIKKWRELFGNKFPDFENEVENNGFPKRTERTERKPKGNFA